MSETKKTRSAWDIIQSVILLLTPVLVVVLGFFFNNSLAQIEKQIANVTAMQPFMEMIADSNVTKSKMGAYAIYMLQKDDDPKMAAQIILAPGKQHLVDVLFDVQDRDTVIRNVLQDFIETIDMTDLDTTQIPEFQKSIIKVFDRIDEKNAKIAFEDEEISEESPESEKSEEQVLNEWLYLGNFSSGQNKDWIIGETPVIGKEYTLTSDANVRNGKPKKSNGYRLPSFVRVAKKGSKIKIDTLTRDKKGHKWARVRFVGE